MYFQPGAQIVQHIQRCCVNMIFLGVLFMRHEQAVKMLFTNKQTNKMCIKQRPKENDKNRKEKRRTPFRNSGKMIIDVLSPHTRSVLSFFAVSCYIKPNILKQFATQSNSRQNHSV